jgi:hypothetical protein
MKSKIGCYLDIKPLVLGHEDKALINVIRALTK